MGREAAPPETAGDVLTKTVLGLSTTIRPAKLFRIARESRDYLDCLVSSDVSSILYVLTVVAASSTYELQLFLNVSSRTMIENRVVKLLNAGLVEAVTKKNPEYPAFSSCWAEIHPNTNKKVTLYVPTEQGMAVVPLFKDKMRQTIPDALARRLSARGAAFRRRLESVRASIVKEDAAREAEAVNVFGACERCSKVIRHDDFTRGKAEMNGGAAYCRACVLELARSRRSRAGRRSR